MTQSPSTTPLGYVLSRIRDRYQITLVDMADGVGMSKTFLHLLETGERVLNRNHVAAIRNYLVSLPTDPRKLAAFDLAVAQTMRMVDVTGLSPLETQMLINMAQQFRDGHVPSSAVVTWLVDKGGHLPKDEDGTPRDSTWQ